MHYTEIERRLGPPRLAILPIGAYKPEWFMGPIHMSPAEAVQAHRDLKAGVSVGMHFGTFDLADDGETEAPDELRRIVAASSEPMNPFWILDFGEGREVPPLGTSSNVGVVSPPTPNELRGIGQHDRLAR